MIRDSVVFGNFFLRFTRYEEEVELVEGVFFLFFSLRLLIFQMGDSNLHFQEEIDQVKPS